MQEDDRLSYKTKFQPTVVYGFAFFNKFYDKIGRENLDSVRRDERYVDSLFKLMQIMDGNIHKFLDASYDEMN